MIITKAQQKSLLNVYRRNILSMSYLTFRRTAFIAFKDCLMVPWCGMLLGIETNGDVHT